MTKPRFLKGLTLTELMIVIVILSILASLVVLKVNGAQKEGRDQARAATASVIMDAVEKYYEEHGDYPYGVDMNPSYDRGVMSSYSHLSNLMPWLDLSALTAHGYNFFAYSCATSSCSDSSADLANRSSQYIYRSAARPGASGSYLRHSMWGCEIMIPDDSSSPGAVLFWKEESTGKWLFKRSKHGMVEIKNWGSGPTPPTTCTFS